jgi:hypothetical protein
LPGFLPGEEVAVEEEIRQGGAVALVIAAVSAVAAFVGKWLQDRRLSRSDAFKHMNHILDKQQKRLERTERHQEDMQETILGLARANSDCESDAAALRGWVERYCDKHKGEVPDPPSPRSRSDPAQSPEFMVRTAKQRLEMMRKMREDGEDEGAGG